MTGMGGPRPQAFIQGLRFRPRPHDFDAVFVRIGWLACKEHYGSRGAVINRWLEEAGKDRLIEARAAHWRKRRIESCLSIIARKSPKPPLNSFRFVAPWLARSAADYLRDKGWIVALADPGRWLVVTPAGLGCWWFTRARWSAANLYAMAAHRSSANLIALAERRGFAAGLRPMDEEG